MSRIGTKDQYPLPYPDSPLETWEQFSLYALRAQQAHGRALGVKQQLYYNRLEEKYAQKQHKLEGDLAPLVAMIQLAGEKLKQPRIRLIAGEDKVMLVKSRTSSAFRIFLYEHITSDRRQYIGMVSPQGHVTLSARVQGTSIETNLLAALNEFSKDPLQAAKAYSRRLGRCCFCDLELEDPPSVTAGYGPICAKNFHLPWGEADPKLVEARNEDLAKRAEARRPSLQHLLSLRYGAHQC